MTDLLPTFEPTAADMVRHAMALPLETKIDIAVRLLKSHESIALSHSPDGYFVAFSGGKDSQVIAELCRMAGVRYTLNYSVTSLDPPELVRFIRREYPATIWHRQPKALLTKLLDKSNGPPTRKQRWCCELYKENGGSGLVKVIGVRAAESKRRAGLWKQVNSNRRTGVIVCPIVYWTDSDVWSFHRLRGLPHCELYDQGFRRLGCIGCPMAGRKETRREFDRWPRYETLWKRAIFAHWHLWHGVPRLDGESRYVDGFATPEAYWRWWVSRVRKESPSGCQMEFLFT